LRYSGSLLTEAIDPERQITHKPFKSADGCRFI
jgi:hypothetical protein